MISGTRAWVIRAMALVGLLVAASGVGARIARSSSPTQQAPSSSADDTAGLKEEMDKLRAEVRSMGRSIGASAVKTTEKAEPKESNPIPVDPMVQHKAVLTDLESRVTRETRSGTWSSDTENALTAAFSNEKTPGSDLVKVACFSTLCKAAVLHGDVEAQREMPRAIAMQSTFSSFKGGLYYTYEQNPPRTVIYMLRDQYSPPDLR